MARAGNAGAIHRNKANVNGGSTQKNPFGTTGARWGKKEGYLPTPAEADLLYEIRRRWDPDGAEANHFAFQRQWWANIAMYSGHQWSEWNPDFSQFGRPKAPFWRVRYIANLIMPMVMSTLARVGSDPAPLRVAPRKPDVKSRSAALLGDRLLQFFNEHLESDEKRMEALLWALVCGSGFMKQVYNPEAGERQTENINGEEKLVRVGDIELEVANPFQMHVPQHVTKFRHFPWIIQDTARTLEYVWEHWPDKAPYVVPQPMGSRPYFFEERIQDLVGIRGFAGSQDVESDPNMVYVSEFWSKPCRGPGRDGKIKNYPNGMRGVIAGGVVLEVGDNPYVELGIGLPFVDYHWIPIPGRFWGMSLVEQLTPPQREYNRGRSQLQEHKNLMRGGKWLLPKGHGIPSTSITSEPGEIVEYNPTLPKPEMITPPPLPNDIMEDITSCKMEMQDIAAQQDVSQAKAPGSIRSGLAVQLLQQQDMARMTVPQRQIWHSDKRLANHRLLIVQKKFRRSRVIAISSPSHEWHFDEFMGSDLRGHTDVRLVLDPGLPQSGVARRQEILDYVQLGVLDPQNPDHQGVMFKSLELGDVQGYVYERVLDETRAEQENGLMLEAPTTEAGILIPPVDDFDDHATHVRVHRRMILSPEFMKMEPAHQDSVKAHLTQHIMALQMAAMAQQEKVEASKGAPGEKGEASQPESGSGGSDGGQAAEGGGEGGPPGGGGGGPPGGGGGPGGP